MSQRTAKLKRRQQPKVAGPGLNPSPYATPRKQRRQRLVDRTMTKLGFERGVRMDSKQHHIAYHKVRKWEKTYPEPKKVPAEPLEHLRASNHQLMLERKAEREANVEQS